MEEVIKLETRLYQEWIEESYGIINLAYSNYESTFNIHQDGIIYYGYQNQIGSKIVLVSKKEVMIGNPDQDFEFIGCAWYGPNMRIAKFSRSITALDLAKEMAERMLF
ncbi:MAG: hypothetical protein K2Q22_09620 [Cytophagales bacterium]|nr:hypothetical protein [Cytophagales bacterium]